MTATEAARLLDLPVEATSEELEKRFLELRARLEDKIAKAPTPGLKEKYRATLAEITNAFEMLTLAADGGSLPVLERAAAAPAVPPAVAPAAAAAVPQPPQSAPKPAGNREFVIVVLIAALLLGAGGWWVVKSRGDAAERARIETEAQARTAAETTRREALLTEVRARLAELNVGLEAMLRQESLAERAAQEARQMERELLRDNKEATTPALRRWQTESAVRATYAAWLRDHLAAHPAKMARVRVEGLVVGKAADDASAEVANYAAALAALQQEVAVARARTAVVGSARVTSNRPGVSWSLVDAFGAEFSGKTPADIRDVAVGSAEITYRLANWPELKQVIEIKPDEVVTQSGDFTPARLKVETYPEDATVELIPIATTSPAEREDDGRWSLEPRSHILKVSHPSFAPWHELLEIDRMGLIDKRITLDRDYTRASWQAALVSLPEIESYEDFCFATGALSRTLVKSGDRAAARRVLEVFARRENPADYEFPDNGYLTGRVLKDIVRHGRDLLPAEIAEDVSRRIVASLHRTIDRDRDPELRASRAFVSGALSIHAVMGQFDEFAELTARKTGTAFSRSLDFQMNQPDWDDSRAWTAFRNWAEGQGSDITSGDLRAREPALARRDVEAVQETLASLVGVQTNWGHSQFSGFVTHLSVQLYSAISAQNVPFFEFIDKVMKVDLTGKNLSEDESKRYKDIKDLLSQESKRREGESARKEAAGKFWEASDESVARKRVSAFINLYERLRSATFFLETLPASR